MATSNSTDDSNRRTAPTTADVAHLDAERVECRWRLLARPTGRATMDALREVDGVAETCELARLVDPEAAGLAAVELHHHLLPKLAAAGVVEYDPRSTTVRYDASGHVESILDCLD